MEPDDVLAELQASGLRGRGGAGFAMGKKASFLPKGDDGQVPRLQRRRVRAGHLQGPRADAEEPAPADRGHDHRAPTRRAPTRAFIFIRGEYELPGRRARRRASPRRQGRLPRRAHPRLRPHARPGRPPRRRRLHLRRGDRAARRARGQARQPAPEAAVPGHPGPLPGPDADQQRRDADERRRSSCGWAARSTRRSAPRRSTGTKVVSVSGCVQRPGNYEIELGIAVARDHLRPRRRPARGPHDQVPGSPAARSSPVLPGTDEYLDLPYDFDSMAEGRLDARLRRDHRRRRLDPDRRRRAQDGEVLPPRVVRQVHAVPRGHQLDREDARAHRARRGHADGPRHHGLGPGADHRQLPVRARRRDGDADRLDDQALPRRSSRSTSRRARERNGLGAAIPQVNRGRNAGPGPMREPAGVDPTAAVA